MPRMRIGTTDLERLEAALVSHTIATDGYDTVTVTPAMWQAAGTDRQASFRTVANVFRLRVKIGNADEPPSLDASADRPG